MWASFTKHERSVLLGLVGLFVVGGAGTTVINHYTVPQVFHAGVKPTAEVAAQQNGKYTESLTPPSTQPLGSISTDGRIDVNSAPADVLEQLPGIGPSKAADIIAYRSERGGFRSPEELDNVKGFGPAAMSKLRDQITVTSAPAAVSRITPPPLPAAAMQARSFAPAARPPVPAPSAAAQNVIININTAGIEELATLHRIGEKLAQRIIEDRMRNGPFQTVEALDRVKGIGPAIVPGEPSPDDGPLTS